MIGQQCPEHINWQIRAGILELPDRDPWSGGNQCQDLSFLLRWNFIRVNPEILEKLEILDHERMDLGIGPYPIEQAMHLCGAFSRRTAPTAGWFALVSLWHGHRKRIQGRNGLPL